MNENEAKDCLKNLLESIEGKEDTVKIEPTKVSEAMEALKTLFGNEVAEDSWDDFGEMLQDMRQHALNNGQAIEIADRPHQLRLGWMCMNTGKTWSIRIRDVKKYKDALEQGDDSEKNKSDILKRAFATQEGKQNLLDVINGR